MEYNIHHKERPSIEELSKRIQDLEDAHALLKQKFFKFMFSGDRKTSNLKATNRWTHLSAHNLTEADYLNILQSIDQPIHITNSNGCIIFRNQAWEKFYGYTADEIRGKGSLDLVIDPKDVPIAKDILKHMLKGECWTGEFPVRNKRGERFVVIGSTKPFLDENGTIIGLITLTAASLQYQKIRLCEPTRVLTDHNKHSRSGTLFWHWLKRDQERDYGLRMKEKVENQTWMLKNKSVGYDKKALGVWSLYNYGVDCEIKWEDLIIRELIGRGSCGTLYHAVWQGSDVALKFFSKKGQSHDLIVSFVHEASLMKRLRHPNILLFMGTVTSPQQICIVTEFLCRGTLFKLLHRNRARLDWRHRVRMAIDIARGINYLHHSVPPIIHRDLNSSILLVDKNWTVKPQWKAPEVLRNEQSADERSDVYSYGVVLWEMTTKKIPWEGLESMQVMEAVGFMNQGLDIPKDVDPQWASLIQRCMCSEPPSRPTFQEILEELHDLHMRFELMPSLQEDKGVIRSCKCETDA